MVQGMRMILILKMKDNYLYISILMPKKSVRLTRRNTRKRSNTRKIRSKSTKRTHIRGGRTPKFLRKGYTRLKKSLTRDPLKKTVLQQQYDLLSGNDTVYGKDLYQSDPNNPEFMIITETKDNERMVQKFLRAMEDYKELDKEFLSGEMDITPDLPLEELKIRVENKYIRQNLQQVIKMFGIQVNSLPLSYDAMREKVNKMNVPLTFGEKMSIEMNRQSKKKYRLKFNRV